MGKIAIKDGIPGTIVILRLLLTSLSNNITLIHQNLKKDTNQIITKDLITDTTLSFRSIEEAGQIYIIVNGGIIASSITDIGMGTEDITINGRLLGIG